MSSSPPSARRRYPGGFSRARAMPPSDRIMADASWPRANLADMERPVQRTAAPERVPSD
jgi:hypothetical protein